MLAKLRTTLQLKPLNIMHLCVLCVPCWLPAATIGNWIGGAICMATVYAFIYGKPPKQFFAWLEQRKLQRQQQARANLKVQQEKESRKGSKAQNVDVRAPITLESGAEVSFAHNNNIKHAS
jgi:hypothetical protein